MTTNRMRPSQLNGRIDAPPSKSYTHRALVAGFLAQRPYTVRHPLVAADTLATRRGLVSLGAKVSLASGRWSIDGRGADRSGGRPRRVRCGESGTTLRFLVAVAAAQHAPVVFAGAPGLAARPVRGLAEAIQAAGVRIEMPHVGSLPLKVQGPMRPGAFEVDGSVSSQYISSLLLVLPTLPAPSRLRVVGTPVSTPYVSATLAVLQHHRVQVDGELGDWSIPGGQSYHGSRFEVPGDASSAAYLWAGAALSGGRVQVRGVPERWPQADRRVLVALRQAGAFVRETAASVEVTGPLGTGFDIDLTESPDLYPLLGAVAACVPATSYLRGAGHVVYKESDRRRATIRLAQRLGASVTSTNDRLSIRGTRRPRPVRGLASSDHRVVMSAAVAALVATGNSSLDDASAVAKSFPGFWKALTRLGAPLGGPA